jgi:hypothetical protein
MFNIYGEKVEGEEKVLGSAVETSKSNLTFEIVVKEVNGKKVVFQCEASLDDYGLIYVDVKNEELKVNVSGIYDSADKIIHFDEPILLFGRKVNGFYVDEETVKKVEEWSFLEREKRRKLKEEKEKREEEEYQRFLSDENYFKTELTISQGGDTGHFYPSGIKNKKIKEFTEEALNKFLDGLIFEDWIPDYWLPNPNAKFYVNDLIKENKARIEETDERRYLVVNADVINTIVNLLKQEIKQQEEERKKKIDELKQKIKTEKKEVLIKQWSEPCRDPNEECDVDIHNLYAFVDKEDAKKFAKENRSRVEYDKELEAYVVEVWYHTW